MSKASKALKAEIVQDKGKGSISIHNHGKVEKLAKQLSALLADSYVLYLKTQNFHWNVKGAMFNSLHLMFEQQYTDLALAIDETAERIRALGHYAPGSFRQYSKLANIQDAPENEIPAMEMVRTLAEDQKIIIATLRKVIELASDIGDEASQDLGVQRLRIHEKNAWMLNSTLE